MMKALRRAFFPAVVLSVLLASCASSPAPSQQSDSPNTGQPSAESREAAGSPETGGDASVLPELTLEGSREFQFGIGIDVDGEAPAQAVADGTVAYVGTPEDMNGLLGHFVVVSHKDSRTERTYYSLMALLSEVNVSPGAAVNRGDRLGTTGPVGTMTELSPQADMMFGIYTREEAPALEEQWGSGSRRFGVYWYDPQKVMNPQQNDGGDSKETSARNFDYDSYREATLATVAAELAPGLDEDGDAVIAPMRKIRITPEISPPFEQIETSMQESIRQFFAGQGVSTDYAELFSHVSTTTVDGHPITFAFQRTLVEPLREALEDGQQPTLYAIRGLVLPPEETIVILVNEFQTR